MGVDSDVQGKRDTILPKIVMEVLCDELTFKQRPK